MNFYPDPYRMEELIFALVPVLTSGIPTALLGIASYVLTSMALYALSDRRGIRHAWLSWVPVLNVWIIGSLSDQYRYVVKGQYKSKRKALLILKFLILLLSAVLIGVCGFMVADLIGSAVYGTPERELIRVIMGSVFSILGLSLPVAGLSIAAAVIRYMAMYDIYTSMDPANNVLFLVISIIFRVTEPFFLFFNRNKDNGMPPRREEPQWQPQEPVFETWDEPKDYL